LDQDTLDLSSFNYFIGIDEVGRGPLAGPVVVCAANFIGHEKDFDSLNLSLKKLGVTDSKKLTKEKRARLIEALGLNVTSLRPNKIFTSKIKEAEISFLIAEVSPERIDEINILQASLEGMAQSLLGFKAQFKKQKKGFVFIDGNKLPKIDPELELMLTLKAFVKGDLHHPIIGVASIVAKEYRDYLMNQMSKNFPQYGFEVHAGYPTPAHLSSIKFFGPCLHHRKSFKGVKEFSGHAREL
jgi:ribonuclease HII